jgi:hypothetical protein
VTPLAGVPNRQDPQFKTQAAFGGNFSANPMATWATSGPAGFELGVLAIENLPPEAALGFELGSIGRFALGARQRAITRLSPARA